jgi:probable HAF family extracellular repeat protein
VEVLQLHAVLRAAAAFVVLAADSNGRAAPQYGLLDIGNFDPSAINNAGNVSGSTNAHAVLWTASSGVINLGIGIGNSINNFGQIVGEGDDNEGFLWTPDVPNGATGTMMTLGDINPQGSERSPANDINDVGTVVGEGWDFYRGGGWRSFIWKPAVPNGQTGQLFSLGGGSGTSMQLNAINASGSIAARNGAQAFVFKPTVPNGTSGTTTSISPGGSITFSSPTDINSTGQIVGVATFGIGSSGHGFLWSPAAPNGTSGTWIDLGTLPNMVNSEAFGINVDGLVVGRSSTGINVSAGFLWTPSEGMIDLNLLLDANAVGWTIAAANDINDAAQIVARATFDPDGPGGIAPVGRTVILTPIPEPACPILFGALALAGLRRRRSTNVSRPRRDTR